MQETLNTWKIPTVSAKRFPEYTDESVHGLVSMDKNQNDFQKKFRISNKIKIWLTVYDMHDKVELWSGVKQKRALFWINVAKTRNCTTAFNENFPVSNFNRNVFTECMEKSTIPSLIWTGFVFGRSLQSPRHLHWNFPTLKYKISLLTVGGFHQTGRYEVLTAVVMNVAIFWDMSLCSQLVNRRFGGRYHLHLHFRPWRWWQFPPKRRFTYGLHGAIGLKIATFRYTRPQIKVSLLLSELFV
jgi:hypothetical protein